MQMGHAIPTVTLADGQAMPMLGLGTWQLDGETCVKAVRTALDLGYTHIDTAEMYKNESQIGEAIQGGDRDTLFITSKVWYDNLRGPAVRQACEQSLRRLGTDHLDLYLVHWPNRRIPMQETLEAMAALRTEGKARSIGISNFTVRHLEQARDLTAEPLVTNQVEFHPHLYQQELLEYCGAQDIVLTAYSPLGRRAVLGDATIGRIARACGKTVGQVTLRWMVQKGIVVIPKASSAEHLEENTQVFDWELSPEAMSAIDDIPVMKREIDWSGSEFE